METANEASQTGDIEGLLAGIWREVLGTENISPESNFFDLGGDSLQLMTMLFRISQDTGVELDPGTVFEGPTIVHLARTIIARRQSQSAETEGTI